MEPLQLIITDIEKLRWVNANAELNKVLYALRSNLVISRQVEIADYNKLKIIKKKLLVEQYLRQAKLKTFQFLIHLN